MNSKALHRNLPLSSNSLGGKFLCRALEMDRNAIKQVKHDTIKHDDEQRVDGMSALTKSSENKKKRFC